MRLRVGDWVRSLALIRRPERRPRVLAIPRSSCALTDVTHQVGTAGTHRETERHTDNTHVLTKKFLETDAA